MHAFFSIWRKFNFVPEAYNVASHAFVHGRTQYPLRPELAESLYYLYQATNDPIWLKYGKEFLLSINSTRVVLFTTKIITII